jgi:V8-like Glu-specific endopeptidase
VTVPDQGDYDKIQSITQSLQAQGAKFEPLTVQTWQKLEQNARRSLLANYRNAKQRPLDTATEETLSNLTSKANLSALSALAKTGTLDSRIANELQLNQSPLLAQDWKIPTGNSLTEMPKPQAQEKISLSFYKRLPGEFEQPLTIYKNDLQGDLPKPQPKRLGSCGSDCALVGAGEPQPGPPGLSLNPVGPSIKVGGMYPNIDSSISSSYHTNAPPRRERPFNPAGFLEVVRIEYSVDTDSCSGTLLSPTVVLTAAHCVYGRSESTVSIFVPTYAEEMISKCTKIRAETGAYTQCVRLTKIVASKINPHPDYDQVKKINDVALVTLSQSVPGSYAAKVEFNSTPPEAISMAGYGFNGALGERSVEMRRALEVGWHQGATVRALDGRIGWQFSSGSNNSATCTGDSGGPIYAGDYNGGTDAGKHIIFALATAGSESSCDDFYVTQTPLSLPPIRDWLCKAPQTTGLIGSCSGNG